MHRDRKGHRINTAAGDEFQSIVCTHSDSITPKCSESDLVSEGDIVV